MVDFGQGPRKGERMARHRKKILAKKKKKGQWSRGRQWDPKERSKHRQLTLFAKKNDRRGWCLGVSENKESFRMGEKRACEKYETQEERSFPREGGMGRGPQRQRKNLIELWGR